MTCIGINGMLSGAKYLAIFLLVAFSSAPANIYLFNRWMAVFLAALIFIPMLGGKPRMEKSLISGIFFGFYTSAFISLIISLYYYYV